VSDEVKLTPFHDNYINRSLTHEWINDPVIMKGILRTDKTTYENHNKWWEDKYYSGCASLTKENSEHFFITEGKVNVGCVRLRNVEEYNQSCELMIYIGSQTRRGKGVAYKAMLQAIAYCFKRIAVHKIYVTVAEDNVIARHLYKKCGFVEEGVFRDAFYQGDKYINIIKMALINE